MIFIHGNYDYINLKSEFIFHQFFFIYWMTKFDKRSCKKTMIDWPMNIITHWMFEEFLLTAIWSRGCWEHFIPRCPVYWEWQSKASNYTPTEGTGERSCARMCKWKHLRNPQKQVSVTYIHLSFWLATSLIERLEMTAVITKDDRFDL